MVAMEVVAQHALAAPPHAIAVALTRATTRRLDRVAETMSLR
jgi:hypothetical protein